MQPEYEDLISMANTIAYVEVIALDQEIVRPEKTSPEGEPKVGFARQYPEQAATVRFIRLLKGFPGLVGAEGLVIKPVNYYYLRYGQRVVVYLRESGGRFVAVGSYGGEHRLASAMVAIKNRSAKGTCGLVAGLTDDSEKSAAYNILILSGRHRYPVDPDKLQKALVMQTAFDGDWIAEIPLKRGLYTVLLRDNDRLHYPYQLADGYYSSFILEDRWEVVYFGPLK